MATLTQLLATADGTIGAVIEHDAGTTPPFWSHIDDTAASDSADYVQNDASETDGTAFFALTNVDADFSSMDTLNIDANLHAINFSDDSCALSARIFDANSTTNALTDETGDMAATVGSTKTTRNATFTGLTGTKAQWDTAHIRFTWTYNKVAQPDNGNLRLFGFDIDGTYTGSQAFAPVAFNHYAKMRNS